MSSTTWRFRNGVTREPFRRLLSARVRRWARRRQGTDAHITVLKPRRVYILPTGVGFVFALTCFAMLLGSMNYNNNLSFVLTFMLVGIGLVAMHQCQRNLVGLEIAFAGVDAVFAGRAAEFRIAITNHSRSHRYDLQLFHENQRSQRADLAPGESRVLHIELPTTRRGYVTLPRFGVRTVFPFELFRAWTWLHMDLKALVYPKPAAVVPEPPATESAQGHRQHDARGEEDFAGLRSFQQGDSPRHVAWKAYARSGELLSKLFSGADTSSQWLDLDSVDHPDLEVRLATVTRWILDADRRQQAYGLRTSLARFEPAHGEQHRHLCLEHLATYGLTAPHR